jgi:acetylornithine deacetylase/succinyl-diaminopimelate desuccinylase-like protein
VIALEQVVADALRLSAIPAPTGQEEARGEAVEATLRGVAGLEVRRDVAGNVVAHAPGRADRAAPVVVTAHLDTVFGPDVDVQPHREPARGGQCETLHGPGIGDNAIALAALIALARELAADAPGGDVVLAATVGEEGLGNLRGVRALLREAPASLVIALEGHSLDRIVTRAVGSVRLGVVYEAAGGHSWQDRGAPSAVHALAEAVTRVVAGVYADVPDCAVNAGVFHGGTSVNTVAARAELQLDLRALDPAALAAAESLARDVFQTVAAERGVVATIAEVGRRPAGSLPDDHPLVATAQQARVAAGLTPAALQDGSTDANAAWEAGIPGISIGVTHGDGVHRLDEWIAVAPVAQGIAAALALVRATARTTY